ncbi:MAG: carboxypeptidase M32 [Lachnospiraceae bacterium]|nr:carboxypeptidase M32 [Lachnospiraceae bacterium]
MSEKLKELKQYIENMNRYHHVVTLLQWDMYTTVPKEGYDRHADAVAYFSTQQFQMSVDSKLGELLEVLNGEEYNSLEDDWKFIVKRMKRDFEKNQKIPAKLYEEYVRALSESQRAWEEAKNASDFNIFAPHLKKLIGLVEEVTGYTDPEKEIYDALLNQYEEGMDSATIDRIFEELKQELIPMIQKIIAVKQPANPKFQGDFDPDIQEKVQKLLLEYIGFRWSRGAVGRTEHPFTLNFTSKDVRVTNHYHKENAISAMFSAIHEGGHGIFEQNVKEEFDGTVAGSCGYMGIHESQSRFYENIMGRNRNFWVPIYEEIQKLLPGYENISLEEFYHEINRVENSLIRVEADELTYCQHIILRYEMEKAIFRDHLPVEELPALWNKKMQEYLQITPPNDAAGILQDMHWSGGSFGYFPSYLLGSIYDGMLLEQVEKELGDLDLILKEGRILEVTKWLNEKIHVYGSSRLPKDTIWEVCGKEVSAKPLIRYFKEKYSSLYGIEL